MKHVHCGDSSAQTLRRSGVPGEVVAWCDLLMDGPLPATAGDADLWRLRAPFLSAATGGGVTEEQVFRRFRDQDAALEACAGSGEEVVLWFDACLYDQFILIRLLDWFARHFPETQGRLSLICIGEFPGFQRFLGLGELGSEQLASLLEHRHSVTAAETAAAQAAWRAVRAASPDMLVELALSPTAMAPLPYAGAALRRFLQHYPSAANGLDRLEQEVLDAVAAGTDRLVPLFRAVSDREDRPFFGDTSLWACVQRLADAETPLLSLEGPGRLPLWNPPRDLGAWQLRLTEAGKAVVVGREDAVRLNGVDRWRGGVHLCGKGPVWRWDDAASRLVCR